MNFNYIAQNHKLHCHINSIKEKHIPFRGDNYGRTFPPNDDEKMMKHGTDRNHVLIQKQTVRLNIFDTNQ